MLYLDLETYSEKDLPKVGAYVYAKASELLLVGYALDDGEAKVWDATDGSVAPRDLHDALASDCSITGHNVGTFDRLIMLQHFPQYDFKLERWQDTQVLCLTNGLPMSLDQACKAVQMPDEFSKLKSDGRRLITLFCKPAPKNHRVLRYDSHDKPHEWADFIEYCRRDVIACRKLTELLDQTNWLSEMGNWRSNLRMNDRGLPMDTKIANIFIEQIQRAEVHYIKRLAEVTDGAVKTHSQVARMLEWLEADGTTMTGMTAALVDQALASDTLSAEAREVLTIRRMLAKSSVKKLNKIISATDTDGALHGAFEFHGAGRTGREAGRIIQPQNLPRTSKKFTPQVIEEVIDNLKGGGQLRPEVAHDTASNLLRAMISAPDGYELVVADLANIEGRVLAWLAGSEWKLQAFREYDAGTGPDLYKLAYSRAFSMNVTAVGDTDRQVGKVMELALGYQGSLGAFKQMAGSYGVDLPDPEIYRVVKAWRMANPEIVKFWALAQQACEAACRKHDTVYMLMGMRVAYSSKHQSLGIQLPSGRILWYREMKVLEGRDYSKLEFTGVDGYTKRWASIGTYGGKLVENITQAVARDVLWFGVRRAEAAGMHPIGTVHDEIICCEPIGAFTTGDLVKPMSVNPEWCADMPLEAEGFTAKRYRK